MGPAAVQRGVPALEPRAYAVCSGAGRVAAIDTAAHAVIGEVAVGDEPMLAALSPDHATLLVTNANSRDVAVIDTAALTVARTVAVADGAAGCAFSPDGARAYVANEHDHTVSVLDARSWRELGRAAVGRTPCELVVMPGGREVVVSNEASSTVGILDGLTGEQRRFVVTPEGPIGLALSPDASALLIGCYGSNHVFCLETARWTIRWRAAVGGNHVGLCFTPDGRRALVTNADGDTISVLDLETRREVSRVRVGPGPATVAVLPGQDRLAYVTIRGADSVAVVDLAEERVVRSIQVGASPLGLCVGAGPAARDVPPSRRHVGPASRSDARGEPGKSFPGAVPSANSFNFERVEDLVTAALLPGFTPDPRPGRCAALGLELRGPAVRSVLLVEPGGAALHRTPTADFSDEAIAAVKLELEQLYLDVTPERGDEPLFPNGVRRLRLHAACRGCPDRDRCCRAFATDEGEGENPFRREESWIRAELSRVRGRLLDVGCGELPYREELRRLIEAGQVEYVGLDPDEAALERLRAVWGFPGELRRGEIEGFDADAARGAFDYVLAFRSLNHFRDVELAFRVITTVLRPGGQLLLCDSPVFALLRTHAQVEGADRRAGGVHEHFRSWTSHQAVELLRRFPLRLNLHRPVTAETANQWTLKYLRRPDAPSPRRGGRG